MKCTIENRNLKASIVSEGAELCSIKSQATGIEYVWQADPLVWGSSAPVLFPIVGGLKNGSFTYGGKQYSMPRHGIVRRNADVHVVEQESDRITFELQTNERSLAQYPFKFTYKISYRLKDNSLIVTTSVRNDDDNGIFFSIGAHPAFNCPIHADQSYSDYYIDFGTKEDLLSETLNADALVSGKTRTVSQGSGRINLTYSTFEHDALMFKNLKSRKATLCSEKYGPVLSVEYDDYKYIGIWAKPNADFVCIEPWLGIADSYNTDGDFTKKDGIIRLEKGGTFSAKYSINILG